MKNVTVNFCKKYLNIEESFNDDNELLEFLISAAKICVLNETELNNDSNIKEDLELVVIMMVAELYEKRKLHKNIYDSVIEDYRSKNK